MSDNEKTKRERYFPAFGKYLRHSREELYNSQLAASQAVGFSQALIAQYELGAVRDPNPDALLKMAEVYHVDYNQLVLRLVQEKYFSPTGNSKGLSFGEAASQVFQHVLADDNSELARKAAAFDAVYERTYEQVSGGKEAPKLSHRPSEIFLKVLKS